jgi:glutamate transport system substrate-binding protein
MVETVTRHASPVGGGSDEGEAAPRVGWLFFWSGLFLVVSVVIFFWTNQLWGATAAAALAFLASVAQVTMAYLIERGVFRQTSRRARYRWQRHAGIAAVLCLAVTSMWVVSRERDPLKLLNGEIRIGYASSDYPGWHSSLNGEPAGFDVEVARKIQDHFGARQITWVELGTVDNRIAALRGRWRNGSGVEQRPVDLVISNFSMTPERAEQIDFAGPYFVDTQGFLSRTVAKDLTDIPRGKVCVLDGSTSSDRLFQRGWNPVELPSLAACINAFEHQEVDAVSGDRSTLAGYAKTKKYPVPLDLGIGAEKYGVGLPNNRPRMCREISKALDDFLDYQWARTFETNLAPLGLNASWYIKPEATDTCESGVPWYGW